MGAGHARRSWRYRDERRDVAAAPHLSSVFGCFLYWIRYFERDPTVSMWGLTHHELPVIRRAARKLDQTATQIVCDISSWIGGGGALSTQHCRLTTPNRPPLGWALSGTLPEGLA